MQLVDALLAVLQRLPPDPCGLTGFPQSDEQVDHGGQQRHTACLVCGGKRDRDQVQERRDSEEDLDVGHRERGSRHALRQRWQDDLQRRVERRCVQCGSCDIGGDSLNSSGQPLYSGTSYCNHLSDTGGQTGRSSGSRRCSATRGPTGRGSSHMQGRTARQTGARDDHP